MYTTLILFLAALAFAGTCIYLYIVAPLWDLRRVIPRAGPQLKHDDDSV